jgi:hypothetical protein
MRSRCMSFLPRTTLHSDSKQVLYRAITWVCTMSTHCMYLVGHHLVLWDVSGIVPGHHPDICVVSGTYS